MSDPRDLSPIDEATALATGERLRALFLEEKTAHGAPAPSPDCPPAETIFDAASGALGETDSQRLLDHALGCASCSLGLRFARELLVHSEQAIETLRPAAPSAPPPDRLHTNVSHIRKSFFRSRIALAAALGAAALVFLVARRTPEAPVFRSGAPTISSLLAAKDSLPRDAFVLRWSPLPAGTRYSVNVATPDLQVLFTRGGLTEAQAQVPASALEKIPAGAQVVWRVTALLADGRRVESTAFLTAVR